jgi:hypothetical protein
MSDDTDAQNPPDRTGRGRLKRLVAIAGCVAATGVTVGCGGAGTVAKEIGVAACLQAAGSVSDATARAIADQACQVGASGDVAQATRAVKQAARDACLGEARRIVDPAARQQVEALCPTVK